MQKPARFALMCALLVCSLGNPVAATATPAAGAADTALHRKVEQRFPAQTAEREVLTRCRKLTVHGHLQFRCRYGIRANGADARHDPYTYWAYSGLGWVYAHGKHLSVELVGPLTLGGEWAPYPSRIEQEGVKRALEEAAATEKAEAEEAAKREAEVKAINEKLNAAEEELCRNEGKTPHCLTQG